MAITVDLMIYITTYNKIDLLNTTKVFDRLFYSR